jgi:hypothetical protein
MAYREALNYFGKLSDFTSLERWKLIGPGQPGQDANRDTPKNQQTHQ